MSFEKENVENELVEVTVWSDNGTTVEHVHEAEVVEVFHDASINLFVVYENEELAGYYPRENVVCIHKSAAGQEASED